MTSKVPYINIIMIGETGAGKSSFLNTFSTALSGGQEIIDIYRVSPEHGREDSATKMVSVYNISLNKTQNNKS